MDIFITKFNHIKKNLNLKTIFKEIVLFFSFYLFLIEFFNFFNISFEKLNQLTNLQFYFALTTFYFSICYLFLFIKLLFSRINIINNLIFLNLKVFGLLWFLKTFFTYLNSNFYYSLIDELGSKERLNVVFYSLFLFCLSNVLLDIFCLFINLKKFPINLLDKKINIIEENNKNLELSELDFETVAIHESGHALFYSLLNEIPKDFSMEIKTNHLNNFTSFGYVSSTLSNNQIQRKKELEWLMLMTLGGKYAEKFHFNKKGVDISSGSIKDLTEYQKIAKNYLSLQEKDIYFIEPINKEELEHNIKLEKSLLKKQEDFILNFFELNQHCLYEISDLLTQKGKLNKKDILPIFQKINKCSFES